jgi:AAA+ superfamily predicted ATPase
MMQNTNMLITIATRRKNHRLNILDAYVRERFRQNDSFQFPYTENLAKKNEFFDICMQLLVLQKKALHTKTDVIQSECHHAHDFLRWLKTKVQLAIDKNVKKDYCF